MEAAVSVLLWGVIALYGLVLLGYLGVGILAAILVYKERKQ